MTRLDEMRDYLGDGVYCHFDGYHIWLTTQEGHRIALEPPVLRALDNYKERVRSYVEETRRMIKEIEE